LRLETRAALATPGVIPSATKLSCRPVETIRPDVKYDYTTTLNYVVFVVF
jgi:hypothetical protein